MQNNPSAKEIFLQALEIQVLEERAEYLDSTCANDDALRRRVDALLAAHDDPDSYLERPAARFDVTATSDRSGRAPGLPDSSASHHGRFLPGTKVADRYRIVSMLGSGGMGEVYRADDLRLGQAVALKFLPPELAKDAKRLEYFHNEVKLARQVSHPNVCRVYDIVEVDGQHFISMEYIDGEDLKTLLRRIGRLPKDKGIQIAQQLCSGIAAAHSNGVLHRDLKPANIMIDGQGQARITDFGLATMSVDGENVVGISGTPAYMAPEQLLRGQTSVQSDLYSLGLIYYEMFTGKTAHRASSLHEIRQHHEQSSRPERPSDVAEDIDPIIERAIERCLESNVDDRPRSAIELASHLPFGNPIAAALAAGDTPSPELIAASGGDGRISIQVASALLAVVVVGLAVLMWISDHAVIVNLEALPKSGEVLAADAQRIIAHLGLKEEPYDWDYDFDSTWRQISNQRRKSAALAAGKNYSHTVTTFWYRQSPTPQFANKYWATWTELGTGRVGFDNPAWDSPGMAGVRLTSNGQLRWFRAIPEVATIADEGNKPTPPPSIEEWAHWFTPEMLGLDLGELAPQEWRRTPPDAFDQIQSWEGKWPGTDERVFVEAAMYRGVPTYFHVMDETEFSSTVPAQPTGINAGHVVLGGFFGVLVLVFLACLVLAWNNWRMRRVDRAGAFRVSVVVMAMSLINWCTTAGHVSGIREFFLVTIGVVVCLFWTMATWLQYIALEPIVRRYWPNLQISWSRLLSGKFSDPLVCRDTLIATAGAVCSSILICSLVPVGGSLPLWTDPVLLTEPLVVLTSSISAPVHFLPMAFAYVTVLILARRVFRSQILAGFVLAVFITLIFGAHLGDHAPLGWLALLLHFFIVVGLLIRIGFLNFWLGGAMVIILSAPITCRYKAFYFGNGIVAMLVVLVIAVYAFYVAVGRGYWRFGTGT